MYKNPIEIIHEEFDYYLMLQDSLKEADSYSKPVIKNKIKLSTKRFRKMEDILFAHAKDISKAYDEILRACPVGMLPHEHPRRNYKTL
jgi:hypothetical protein